MNFIHSNGALGFVYAYQCLDKAGNIKWELREENLIPDAARDYFLNAALNGATQFNRWYIGLYERNRAPVVSDTMASFIADCQEITTYTSVDNSRLVLHAGPLSDGVWSNLGNVAEFAFTATKTVRGGFISSNATQNHSAGLLLSAVRNSTDKTVEAGEILRVTAGLSLTTV